MKYLLVVKPVISAVILILVSGCKFAPPVSQPVDPTEPPMLTAHIVPTRTPVKTMPAPTVTKTLSPLPTPTETSPDPELQVTIPLPILTFTPAAICPTWVSTEQDYSHSQWESMPRPRKPGNYIGFQFKSIQPMLELNAEWAIDDSDYGIIWFSEGNADILWFIKQLHVCPNRSFAEVIDVLELPVINKEDVLVALVNGDCRINGGGVDPELVVIVEREITAIFTNIKKAWRANRMTERFETIPPTGIRCMVTISE